MQEQTLINKLSYFFIILVFFNSCEKPKAEESTSGKTGSAIYDAKTDKLWFHKANTIELANSALKEYPGIEFDVVFDAPTNTFDIRHDINTDPSGITLDSLFNNIENCNNYYYWIDFKNLLEVNLGQSLEQLKIILNRYQLYDNVIVESPAVNLLGIFSQAGIYTSYWVPQLDYPYSTEDAKRIKNIINENLIKYSFNALSAYYTNYHFLNEYFPKSNIHLWTNGLVTEEDKEIIRQLAEGENVKVILVDYKENFFGN